MLPWIFTARELLRRAFANLAASGGRTLLPVALGAGGAIAGSALADPAGGLLPGFGGDERPKRRRRRRALTASDRADIAFVAGALGQAAGKAFAVQLVAGLTR